MKSELLAKSPLLALPLVALILFMTVFLAVLLFTMRRRAPSYDPVARMPLYEEEEATSTGAMGSKGPSS